MFTDYANFYYVFGPTLVVAIVISQILLFKSRRARQNKLHEAINKLKYTTIATGIVLVGLWILLPITPVLSSFGYPISVDDIQSAKHLLKYLQDYNSALVRTTMVVHWFIFVFVWWFLTTIYNLSKALTTLADEQSAKVPEKTAF